MSERKLPPGPFSVRDSPASSGRFGFDIGGKAWEIPGQIWYRALQTLNNPLATFHDWALETHEAAQNLHGNGSIESHMLRRAWKLVGIQI